MGDVMIESSLAQTTHSFILSRTEGSKTWTSDDNVQLWISKLEEREFSQTTSESSSPTKSSFDSDVFLQLPGGDSDDLALGAEAKHYGHFSPRLSPIVSFEKEEIDSEEFFNEHIEESVIRKLDERYEAQRLDGLKEYLKQQNSTVHEEESTPYFISSTEILDHQQDPTITTSVKRNNSLTSQESYSSFSSSFDKPSSLAAFFRPDPEELLFNLGFGGSSSLLQTIPERFFINQSEAYGINVADIHNTLLLDDQEESVVSTDPSVPNHVLHRFSESSIEFTSVTSTESLNQGPLSAKTRRILFKSHHQDIPSIHLTRDEDRSLSPTTASVTSSSSNRMKLGTLEELPEPNSRGSSFDNDSNVPPKKSPPKVDAHVVEFEQKLSEVNDSDKIAVNKAENVGNDFINNSLQMPPYYKRTLSDKSMSSIVTVIGREDTLESSDKEKADSTFFKPIKNGEVMEQTEQEDRTSPSLSAANRRSIFGSYKNGSKTLSDHVFSSGETHINSSSKSQHSVSETLVVEDNDENLTQTKPAMDINDVRKASLNDSFKDFIKSLSGDSGGSKVTQEADSVATDANPSEIEIHVEPPTPSVREECQVQNSDEKLEVKSSEENSKPESPTKKGFFSAAIDSVTNVFTKYQDSKQSTCEDNVEELEKEITNPATPVKKPASSFFRLFNHQTLPVHSNSAFSSFTSGTSNGIEVELDDVSDVSNDSAQLKRRKDHRIQPPACSNSNVSSDDVSCSCPTTPPDGVVKRDKVKYKHLNNNNNKDDIRDVKCPLGKNCSLVHKNGRHVYPNENINDRLKTRKASEASSMPNSFSAITHEHFEHLVQQMVSLRTDVKVEFQKATDRENDLKEHFTQQFEQMRTAMTNDYMGWIAKEMQQLKNKLQEKDEEIRRLRDLVASAEATKCKRKDSIGTPV